jgi:probable HAF family extracellular repeat protein
MQSRILTFMTAIALFAALAFPVRLAQAQEEQEKKDKLPKYYVFNLGAPGGGTTAMAASINNIGWVAGAAYQPGDTSEHAELWLGVPLDLGTLGGPNSAVAWPNKNNNGEIVGIAETADVNLLNEDWSCALANFPTITKHVCLGFAWEDGVMSSLPPLAGGLDSYAASINNLGQIAGWAENGVHDATCAPPQVLQFEPVVWGPKLGEMTQLPLLSGDVDGAATAVNDKNQVVGISGICDQAVGRFTAKHAVLWQNGSPINLGNFDGGVAWNTPTALNNRGQVVGFANLADTPSGAFNPVAFLWTKEHHIEKLLPIGTDSNSWAWGINENGQVVGQSFGANDARAFLYEDGLMTDLNNLIQPNSSLSLLLANDVNDRGEIVGYAMDTSTGSIVAFLAVPVSGGGESAAASAARAEGSSQKVIMPESIRRQLPGFSRFVAGSTGAK